MFYKNFDIFRYNGFITIRRVQAIYIKIIGLEYKFKKLITNRIWRPVYFTDSRIEFKLLNNKHYKTTNDISSIVFIFV